MCGRGSRRPGIESNPPKAVMPAKAGGLSAGAGATGLEPPFPDRRSEKANALLSQRLRGRAVESLPAESTLLWRRQVLTAGVEGLLRLRVEGRPLAGLALQVAAREGHAVVLQALLKAFERLLVLLRRLSAWPARGAAPSFCPLEPQPARSRARLALVRRK